MNISRSMVCEGIHLEVAPERFGRVQFRGIRRKELHMEFAAALEKSVDIFGAVSKQSIPKDEQRSLELGSEFFEKPYDLRAGNIGIGVEGKVKSHPLADRGESQGGDHGNLLVRAGLLIEDGGLTSRRPSASEQRSHQDAAFVNKNEMGFQLMGFFLMRGHSFFIQSWMAFSSRSRARLSGLWGLHPRERSRRPMWST